MTRHDYLCRIRMIESYFPCFYVIFHYEHYGDCLLAVAVASKIGPPLGYAVLYLHA